jgi:hypothetical protein
VTRSPTLNSPLIFSIFCTKCCLHKHGFIFVLFLIYFHDCSAFISLNFLEATSAEFFYMPKIIITPKSVHLLTMGTFNMFLVLTQFCIDKIKYCWNILSRPNKSMVVISTTNFLTIIKTFVYMFIFLLLLNHI